MGNTTFRATVLHDLGHGLVPYGTNDHETGGILNPGFWKNIVSPMRVGCIDAGCSGTPPVDENCSGNPEGSVNAINNEFSSCAKSTIHDENEL